MAPKAKRPRKKLDQRQFDIYDSEDYSPAPSQSHSILGRPNTLINILSQEAPARPKAPVILDFEEDEGFRYKRSQESPKSQSSRTKSSQNSQNRVQKSKNGSKSSQNGAKNGPNGTKKSISTPVSRLKLQTATLDDDDIIQFVDIEPVESVPKAKPRSKSKKTGRVTRSQTKLTKKPASTRLAAKPSVGPGLSSPIRSPLPVLDYSSDGYHEEVSHHTIELVDDSVSVPSKRRTSYVNRGKRVLSIGNGFVGEPHDNIDPQDYYKFLNTSMPDPNRMRQLLVWCFKKALLQHQSLNTSETVRGITKVIADEFLDGLTNGKISTSWYNRQEVEPAQRPILPNPLNETNEETIILFEEKLLQIRKEKLQWENAYKRAIKPIEATKISDTVSILSLEKYLRTRATQSNDSVDYSSLVVRKSLLNNLEGDLEDVNSAIPASLEAHVDRLHTTAYQMAQAQKLAHKLTANAINDKVSSLVRRFIARNNPQNYAGTNIAWPLPARQLTTHELLRGISRVDATL